MSNENSLLKVGIKNGTFYLSENEQKDKTWEKQEFKNPQTGADMVKYHKNISVKGALVYLAMKESPFRGVGYTMNMIVAGEEESYALEIPIMNANGKVRATNEYFNSLVGVMEKLSKGDEITMFVNNRNKDKNDRLYRNIVVLDADGKLIKSDFSFKDVPNWESTTTVDDFGKEVKEWNPSPANKFFIEKFKAVSARWEAERLSGKEQKEDAPAQTPETQTPPATQGIVDQHDDLPF